MDDKREAEEMEIGESKGGKRLIFMKFTADFHPNEGSWTLIAGVP